MRFPEAALKAFFDEVIVVKGVRTGSRPMQATLACCLMDDRFADPITDADCESRVRERSVVVRRGDWVDDTEPQAGDTVTFSDGRTFAFFRLDFVPGGDWLVVAREVVS